MPKNTDKPIEYSSLKKSFVRRLEKAAEDSTPQNKNFDPRFQEYCGKLDKKQFRQAYGFMETMRKEEKERLKRQLEEIEEDLEADASEDNENFEYDEILLQKHKKLKKSLDKYSGSKRERARRAARKKRRRS
mmetsp:Transcript_21842/g.33948  ORF Transcript_21842/g.33948 Transcript_21842/m.33948 type:complete len:132 (-) Transcript_21842:37-432(-)|eukprot:CAMPEP_0201523802 /NCGR_PEP_ID=MMETSP0161_2-20130828/20932_1 /ASSEMBLY_ACC=CAM_ASM_000251 /TAXON_ID=180227 /ORGANISM="Neoparamoeba aestuarina, Strain SoJaBio B1-5/56/2" /LENGTH=131 /DNA_ID=CAMNT_0047923017 /DNA_START=27 /DNA_END=422 /DNA_ORIENTATION=-